MYVNSHNDQLNYKKNSVINMIESSENMQIEVASEQAIIDLIYNIRGKRIMLDRDLVELYEVKTKVLNQAVKRNILRFPEEFMFQLDENEFKALRSQFVTLNKGRGTHSKYLPYVFTEQGVAMLSAVLKTAKAIDISINIMRAFTLFRNIVKNNATIFERVDNLEIKVLDTDKKVDQVLNAMNSKKLDQGIFFKGQ